MTKSSTVWTVASGTVVTVCVAGGGLIGLTRALEPQPTSTSVLTTSHGVMTKPTDGATANSTTPHVSTTPAPRVGDTVTAPPQASDPTIVPPAAPKILDAPAPHGLEWAADRWAHNGDAHHWMHRHTNTDGDLRTSSGDPTPDSWRTPSPEAPTTEAPTPALRMAPMQQQTDQQSHDQYRAPGPRHRADDRGDFGQRGTADGHGGSHLGGHYDDSHGWHR